MIRESLSHMPYRAALGSAQDAISLVIADHHEAVRYGLLALLDGKPGILIVGEAESPNALRSVLGRTGVDIVLFDLCNDDQERVELVREVSQAYPAARLLMFVEHIFHYQIDQLLQVGASGFLSKRASAAQILSAITAVYHGRRLLQAETNAHPMGVPNIVPTFLPAPNESLTRRDLEVLQHLVDGTTNKEMATLLSIAPKTVETRVAQICAKLGARSRTDAAVRAVCLGLVRPHLLAS